MQCPEASLVIPEHIVPAGATVSGVSNVGREIQRWNDAKVLLKSGSWKNYCLVSVLRERISNCQHPTLSFSILNVSVH